MNTQTGLITLRTSNRESQTSDDNEAIFWPVWIVWSGLLLFMILSPTKWRGIVEKVNPFSTRIGILGAGAAAKANVFDEGIGLKILVLISLVGNRHFHIGCHVD